MNDHGFTAANILSTLPPVLANDENIRALAESIAGILSRHDEDVEAISMYPNILSLPEDLCDILAKDFDIGWYEYNYPLQIKRNQVESNFRIHRKLGTAGAVEQALSDIFPDSSVYEWFQYGGDPYYFRVVLDVTNQIITNIYEPDIRKAISLYKSLRSRLENDSIIFRSRSYFLFTTSAGYVLYNVRLCGTYPYRATQGQILEGNIVLETEARGIAYETPGTGDTITGTYPRRATQGQITQSGFLVSSGSSGGASYISPYCGDQAAL